MSKLIFGLLGLVLAALVVITGHAHGAERMGKITTDVYFKVDGKKATALEADAKARDHKIEKCSPVKNTEPPAFKCVEVVKEYSPKTGSPTWKRP